jgi:hypothetical protein
VESERLTVTFGSLPRDRSAATINRSVILPLDPSSVPPPHGAGSQAPEHGDSPGPESDATDAHDLVDAALQASSAALIALQVSLANVNGLPAEYGAAAAPLRAAIEAATVAIAELQDRSARSPRSVVAHGFVLRRPKPPSGD